VEVGRVELLYVPFLRRFTPLLMGMLSAKRYNFV